MEVKQKKKIPVGFLVGAVLAVAVLGAGVYGALQFLTPKGCRGLYSTERTILCAVFRAV